MKRLNASSALSHPLSRTCIATALSGALLLFCAAASSQTIYRIVDSEGRVTFSDKAPATNETATTLGIGGRAVAASTAALPPELRQAVSKFPVTLYTGANCLPCGQGRELLNGRGIPYTEKTIITPEDAAALQRISGSGSLPLLTIGSQQIKGFSDLEWTQFLDAAAYPASSALPTGYRNPLPTSLVAVQKAAPANPSDASQNQTPVTPANAGPSNPAGISF